MVWVKPSQLDPHLWVYGGSQVPFLRACVMRPRVAMHVPSAWLGARTSIRDEKTCPIMSRFRRCSSAEVCGLRAAEHGGLRGGDSACARVVDQIAADPVPQIMAGIVDGVQHVPQEHVQYRVVERIGGVPAPQI